MYEYTTYSSHIDTLESPTRFIRGAGRSLRMVGTPNVWWVWSGGAPPTTCFTSDEDRYSERGAKDMEGDLPASVIIPMSCNYTNVHVQVENCKMTHSCTEHERSGGLHTCTIFLFHFLFQFSRQFSLPVHELQQILVPHTSLCSFSHSPFSTCTFSFTTPCHE